MKFGWAVVLAATAAWGQSVSPGNWASGGGYTWATAGGTSVNSVAQLPQVWVNALEYRGTTSNTINFPSTGSGGSWTCGSTNYGPYTAGSQSSLQTAINNAEACRTANGSGAQIKIPAALYTSSSGLVLPQTAGDNSTSFIILTSTTPLAAGETVCSHGIQDNVSESTQPGVRNVGCTGSSMSYMLGTTITYISSGAFILANGTATNTANYDDSGSMWELQCTAANCNALSTAAADANGAAPHHFAILNANIHPQAGSSSTLAPVAIGQGNETATSQFPQHIHLAYDFIHGDWADPPGGASPTGPPSGSNSLPNVIAFNACTYCSLSYSYIDEALRPGAEGHGISQLLTQQMKFVHNWIEGQSIGMLCGGWSSAMPINGFVGCMDTEERGNRWTYPYSWLLASAAGFTPSAGNYVRKNSHEFKLGNRNLMDGNIFENVDDTGAQNGIIISGKTDQTSGGSLGSNYWILQQNLTITNNVLRNSCNGVSLGFRSGTTTNNGGGVTLPAAYYYYVNNLLYNASANNPGCGTSSPYYTFRINNANQTWGTSGAQRDSTGSYVTLALNSSTGQTISDQAIGDPVYVGGCADPTFNTSTASVGPPALAGTTPNGLTIVYANPGTPNATTTGCTFSNIPGWTAYLMASHNSDFGKGNNWMYGQSANTPPYQLARYITLTNDIQVGGGGITSTAGEGTRTTGQSFDPATLILNNTLIAGRDSAVTCPSHPSAGAGGSVCYKEYGGPNAGASPPVTLYLKPAGFCIGNDPTAENCAGILGFMSQSSTPQTLSDWHQFRLCHTGDAACNNKPSPYSAGQTYQGSDATDLGFNPTPIDAAETSTQYSCIGPCGSPGPYPDK